MIDLNTFSHSNDYLEIVPRNQRYCVRKTFKSDLARAQRSVNKQRIFQPIYNGAVRVSAAEVIEFNVFSDRAELLMPYIEGITGNMFPIHATRNVAHALSSSLSTLLFFELNNSVEHLVETRHFFHKISIVYSSTEDLDLKQRIVDCQQIIQNLPDELSFPLGPCHGDLTLSNIILDPSSGITLIDFLDTFLESPLQDVAKLKQDFTYGWSFRKESPSIGVKAEILCRYHYPEALIQIEKIYPIQVKLLTLMALARISPYVKDIITQKWLNKSLVECIKSF